MENEEKIQICKLVAQIILADGQLTDTEHDLLVKLMDRYGLSDEEKKQVTSRNIDDDAEDMAKKITNFQAKSELLTELATAVAVDGNIAPSEEQLLKEIAKSIDVSDEEVEAILMAVSA